jgi:HEAT repeat protein
MLRKPLLILGATWCVWSASAALAYVDLAPTLARLVRDSQTITLAEVDRFSREKGMILLKKVRDLKGQTGSEVLKHVLIRAHETGMDRSLLDWAEPGSRCVLFTTQTNVLVCVGECWYQANASADGWCRLSLIRTELPLAYYGRVSRLADAIPAMLAGKTAVITTLPHGADNAGASFDLALNRASLPGLVKVQRVWASERMPNVAMELGRADYVIGPGRAGREDVPQLRKRLHATDATIRAESAADLGFLGSDAVDAAADLTEFLDDRIPAVRFAAASALLRVASADPKCVRVLKEGLKNSDASIRRSAARASGVAGAAAAPLTKTLAELLRDPDEMVRRSALQGLATLGPVSADSVGPISDLLSQPETAVDAADALGRIGPAARPVLPALAKMLSGDGIAERWAAVRAMSQIGGPGAEPAVQFMIRELPKAPHIESYNMLIYLSLLGPVAKDAIPAARQAKVMNGSLRDTTVWAIDPGSELPELGGAGDMFFIQFILESYMQEFGDRFKPVAASLARKILAGNAGDIPDWGYKLLAKSPEQTLEILLPALKDERLAVRERATVALGFMGRSARAAKPHLLQALESSTDPREQLLLRWCLRKID